ncbi:MAG: hypothetical protein LRY73_09365 [Bacillus sp. (in: Bacteria)]|nr:hypothetical protein [Bacillus sp. (in: firmicutes)]
MKKRILEVVYIIGVLLILSNFNNRPYNIGELSFILPAVLLALAVGVSGVYIFGKDMKLHKNLYFISYVLAVMFVFVPVIGVYSENGNLFYGFPAQWFNYYEQRGLVDIHILGFIFNFFVFYFLLKLLRLLYLRLANNWNIRRA